MLLPGVKLNTLGGRAWLLPLLKFSAVTPTPERHHQKGVIKTHHQRPKSQPTLTLPQGKRVFIKDIIHYLFPPNGQPAHIAPSLATSTTTNGTLTPNPTVLPLSILSKFHFTFLIRHPRRAIPSYYRCTIPPLSHTTGFHSFLPSEAGYDEVRRFFDYLRATHLIGTDAVPITVVDADDLLDHPAEVLRAYCEAVGVDFQEGMLKWGDADNKREAERAFEKWNGFHEDAIGSSELKPREGGAKAPPTVEEEDAQWREKYGEEGQRVIRETVERNVADYEYMKGFALKF